METLTVNDITYFHNNGNLEQVKLGKGYYVGNVSAYEIQFQSYYLNRKREIKDLVETLDTAINELKQLIK